MKNFYLILLFIIATFIAQAQDADQPETPGKKQQDIEALKVAFISKELELTPAEAEKFWPVFNEYSKEMKALKMANKTDNIDQLDGDEKVLNLRKHYKDRFSTVLGSQRVNKFFGIEKRFNQVLINAIQRQKQQRPNRQPRRN